MSLKMFLVVIVPHSDEISATLERAPDWRAAVLGHELNPFVDDNGDADGSLMGDDYEEAVSNAFNMDCDLSVQELYLDDYGQMQLRPVE